MVPRWRWLVRDSLVEVMTRVSFNGRVREALYCLVINAFLFPLPMRFERRDILCCVCVIVPICARACFCWEEGVNESTLKGNGEMDEDKGLALFVKNKVERELLICLLSFGGA